MDDLNGLDWTASSSTTNKQAPVGTGNYFTTIRTTPVPVTSGASTPVSAQGSGFSKPQFSGVPKSSTPANDSFSNLVNFGSSKSINTLTLQEQQQKLQEEKLKKAEEQKKQLDAQFGHSQFWDGLGNGSRQPASIPAPTSRTATPSSRNPFSTPNPSALANGSTASAEDDDLFAAFNADTKVDNSSHYPPPPVTSAQATPDTQKANRIDLNDPAAWESAGAASASPAEFGDDDDDPFGLGQMAAHKPMSSVAPVPISDEDDFLGDLGKPVEEIKRKTPVPRSPSPPSVEESQPDSDDPWDKAVGEIVEMGFSAEQAREALTENGSGLNVQAAVGWLLNEAHRKTQSRNADRNNRAPNGDSRDSSRPREPRRDTSAQRRLDNRSPAMQEDLTKTAAAVGSNLFKTANSLWKTSQKKVQQAVAEFQQESDPNQPKWMRDVTPERQRPAEKSRPTQEREFRNRPSPSRAEPDVTDEALMLEAGTRPAPRKPAAASSSRSQPSTAMPSRTSSPPVSRPSTGRSTPVPKWQQSAQAAIPDTRSRLSKQAVEDEAAQAYVSSARRKKPTPQPKPAEEPDLLFESARASHQAASTNPFSQSIRPQTKSTSTSAPAPAPAPATKPPTPISVRPKAPSRSIPSVSPSALALSAQHRLAGTAHFKRGDYASAHSSYTSSLSSLPATHPITIIILCNRSLTAIKTGDPKAAVNDADQALSLIGPSHGDNESINLGSGEGEGEKNMKEFYGKALMRKAEALEQMERWSDAGAVWRLTVEAGIGGATAIQGRQRCEKALAPKATPKPKAAPTAKPKPSSSAVADLGGQDTEAVRRLRQANAAAEKADDEKFALSDAVTLKLANWQNGRKDNLRALLGSMDSVLWEGSGWKKVGMHELVMNNKVKIVYMKAISKVHPDKLPPNPPTEMKMLAEGIFATLNESWDSFKAQNGL